MAAPTLPTPATMLWPCWHCRGTGLTGALIPACALCRVSWHPARFDAWIETYDRGSWLLFGRNRYRWDKLPCGHPLAGCLTFRDERCPRCDGTGMVEVERTRPRSMADFRPPRPQSPPRRRVYRAPAVAPIQPPYPLRRPLRSVTSGPLAAWWRALRGMS